MSKIRTFAAIAFAFVLGATWVSRAPAQFGAAPAASVAPHHIVDHFVVAPGGSASVTLPSVFEPMRIEVQLSQSSAVLQPSALMSALVERHSGPSMSWIGTNNDGSQRGSNPAISNNIANLYCGNSSCLVASLVEISPSGVIAIQQNAATTSVAGNYTVSIWY